MKRRILLIVLSIVMMITLIPASTNSASAMLNDRQVTGTSATDDEQFTETTAIEDEQVTKTTVTGDEQFTETTATGDSPVIGTCMPPTESDLETAAINEQTTQAATRLWNLISEYKDPEDKQYSAYYNLLYKDTWDDVQKERYAYLKNVVEKIISDAGATTDYDKTKAIAFAIAKRVCYDYPYVKQTGAVKCTTLLDPYDVWEEQYAICEGYSNTFKVFMDIAGIPCYEQKGKNHAFNLVYDKDGNDGDGRWFWVDTTWLSKNSSQLTESGDPADGRKLIKNNDLNLTWFDTDPVYFMSATSNHYLRDVIGLKDPKTGMTFYFRAFWNNDAYVPEEYKELAEDNTYDYDSWPTQESWHFILRSFKIADTNTTSLNLAVPDAFAGLPVTSVYGYAMQNITYCKNLKELKISGDNFNVLVDSLGATGRTLANMPKLEKVDFSESGLEYIAPLGNAASNEGAFENDTSLKEILFPKSLKFVGKDTFKGCTALEHLDLSGTQITSLGGYVFGSCTALKSIDLSGTKITDLNLNYDDVPSSRKKYALLTGIDRTIFTACPNLESINLSNTGITSIPEATFKDLPQLTELYLPDTIESSNIADGAFSVSNNDREPVVTTVITNKTKEELGYTDEHSAKWSGRILNVIKTKEGRKDISSCSVSADTLTYNESAQSAVFKVKDGEKILTEGTDYIAVKGATDSINAGNYTEEVLGLGSYTGSLMVNYSIEKAPHTITMLELSSIAVGETKALTLVGIIGSCTFTSSDDNIATVNSFGKVTGVSEGTVTITLNTAGNENYLPAVTSIQVTVTPKKAESISNKIAILSKSTYTYDGTAKQPEVTITGLTAGTDFVVTYENNINAGETKAENPPKAIITGIGKYTGTLKKTFSISKVSISTKSMNVSIGSIAYLDENTQLPVTIEGLILGTDFTVKYSNYTYAGTATATITGIGNYTGTLKKTYTVRARKVTATPKPTSKPTAKPTSKPATTKSNSQNNDKISTNVNNLSTSDTQSKPKAASLKKVAKGRKSFTVKWKKIAGISGYEIQYSLKSTFKGAKSAKVKASAVSKKVKKLKGGKKYYVRIRTYNIERGRYYYSNWSKTKTVKTKK